MPIGVASPRRCRRTRHRVTRGVGCTSRNRANANRSESCKRIVSLRIVQQRSMNNVYQQLLQNRHPMESTTVLASSLDARASLGCATCWGAQFQLSRGAKCIPDFIPGKRARMANTPRQARLSPAGLHPSRLKAPSRTHILRRRAAAMSSTPGCHRYSCRTSSRSYRTLYFTPCAVFQERY